MSNKQLRRSRFNEDGLPKDARDWTEEDWRDLHEAMESVKRKVKVRHARIALPADGTGRGRTDPVPVRDMPAPESKPSVIGLPDVHSAG